jgi:hypothetical protein
MQRRTITRWQAAPIHLGISVLVAALVFCVIYFVWYPGALFEVAGGLELLGLIVAVDITIGPLITLIIYRPGKKGLAFDLAAIAVMQLAALVYGMGVLYESRPAWIVYVTDRYELVRANELADREKAKAPYDEISVTGPGLVGARLPKDPNEQLALAMTSFGGRDVQNYPKYYVPYGEVRDQIVAHAKPIADLPQFNPASARAEIDAIPARYGLKPEQVGFLPMRAGKRDLTAIVRRDTGEFLGTYALKPWKF